MTRRNAAEKTESTEETTVALDEPNEPSFDELVEKRAQELADQKFAEMKEAEAAKKGKKNKPEKRKPDLPEGYIAPVAFRHALVERGLASDSMSPVQIYSLARKAASNGMPVKHFDKAGNAYDEIQMHPDTNVVLTRPGLKLEEGLDWWQNRPKRQPGQKREENGSETVSTPEDEDQAAADDDELAGLEDEDFAEAE